MSKVNFKSYQDSKQSGQPSQIEIVATLYGPYLSISKFAECIGVKYNLAYGIVKSGLVKVSRTRGHSGAYRISAVDVVKYMDKVATQITV
jgi:hypothetical protein